ncbi:uncharacterized protein P884DRAFT_266054 [Thermothelomyces heterothallicus CBS 202.75]|uniref:uncharacterized protein n=1 Tax=Thermothelomyces heterothallicus CBS 202.75 TaxID=1149848 RepID=UPI003742545D
MPPDRAGFNDVYTLSIPSFEWIKMYPTDDKKTGSYPNHSLTCNVVDNAQMIVLGGIFPTMDSCDNQGSVGGGATKTAPADGFSNPDLRVLMTRKASIATRTLTRAVSSATGVPGANDDSLSASAIAGIAVGGAVALLALLASLFFLIRRSRRRKYGTTTTTTTTLLQPHFCPAGPPDWSSTTYTTGQNSPCSPHSPFPGNPQANGTRHAPGPAELPASVDAPPPPPPPPQQPTPPPSAPPLAYPGTSSRVICGTARARARARERERERAPAAANPTPRTKIDADGRVWVQVTSRLEGPERGHRLAGLMEAATVRKHGYGPRAVLVTGRRGAAMMGCLGWAGHHHHPAGTEQQQQQQHGLEPQELSAEPSPGPSDRGAAELPGSGAERDAHGHHDGRPRHLTFYHPECRGCAILLSVWEAGWNEGGHARWDVMVEKENLCGI